METTADEVIAGYVGLSEAFSRLCKNKNLLDFIVKSDSGTQWQVHKMVLFAHSDVLHRMSEAENFVEAQKGRVLLKGFDDSHIEALVYYMYETGFYVPSSLRMRNEIQNDGEIKFVIKYLAGVYRLADMYNIPNLAQMAARRFDAWMMWDTEEMELGTLGLVLDAIDEIEEFPAAIWNTLVENVAIGFSVPQPMTKAAVREFLEEHAGFAVDVLAAMVEKNRCDHAKSGGDNGL